MKQRKWTTESEKGEITLYKLTNKNGASVVLSSLGAGIISIIVPDRNGRYHDVVLGYANPSDYLYDAPHAGKTVGRYAGRIADGKFNIDETEYQLAQNCGKDALHGGPEGFANRIWESQPLSNGVMFSLVSNDGDEGYPGQLAITAQYIWSDDNQLTIRLRAATDKKTIINLTNHTYFNLAGERSGCVLGERLWIPATQYLSTDENLVPTGEFASVEGTPMDFREEKIIGQDIEADFPELKYAKGYDNTWVVDDWKKGELKTVTCLSDDATGRTLEIESTQPSVHVYTGNWLSGSPRGKSGGGYLDYDGIAIECQGMPDAPNKPQFPSQLLNPGEKYDETIIFKFGIKY